MSYEISPNRVKGVVTECENVIGMGHFNTGEVIVGLSEMLGRVIVKSCDTPISMAQAQKIVEQHLAATLHHGAIAKGFNVGQGA